MNEKTDAQDKSISLLKSRRKFLIGAGTGVVAFSLVPFYEPLRVEAAPLESLAYGGFIKALFRFARKIGMAFLGFSLSSFLESLQFGIRQKIDENLAGLFGRGYGQGTTAETEVATGDGVSKPTMFVPLVNDQNRREGRPDEQALVPFYDVSQTAKTRVGSVLSTPTMSGLPSVADDLEQEGHGPDDLYRLLVPTSKQQNSYNMKNLPDTYLTHSGAVEANYHPYDSHTGDLDVRVTRKRPGKSERLEQVLQRTYGLRFA